MAEPAPALLLVEEERLLLVREDEERVEAERAQDERDERIEDERAKAERAQDDAACLRGAAVAVDVPPFPSSSELPPSEPSSPETFAAAPASGAALAASDDDHDASDRDDRVEDETDDETGRDVPPVVDSEPTFELVESQPAGAVMHVTALATPDEMSIPPVGDLAVEPIADRFFSEGEVLSSRVLVVDAEDEAWDPAVDKGQRKSLPHVVERRARFSKYVRWAVGGASVLCVAALATAFLPSTRGAATASLHDAPHAPPVTKAAAALEAPLAPAAAVQPAPQAPAASAEGNVDAPKVDVPKAEGAPEAPSVAAKAADVDPAAAPVNPAAATAGAAPAPVAEAPKAEAAAAAAAPTDKTALQEKNDARRLLERGKLADAIASGERSVALDPTDGEAWLLLGASYQEKGKIADARRCYTACVKEGKRGPLGECGAMLR